MSSEVWVANKTNICRPSEQGSPEGHSDDTGDKQFFRTETGYSDETHRPACPSALWCMDEVWRCSSSCREAMAVGG